MNEENIQTTAEASAPIEQAQETTTNAPATEATQETTTNQYDTILGGKAGADANSNTDAKQPVAEPSKVIYDFAETVKAYEGFEFTQESSDKFVETIKDMNLSNEQANAIVKHGMEWGTALVQQAQAQVQAELDNMVKGWGESAKQELGANFEPTLSKAAAGLERLEKVVPNLRQALAETGAGNRVEFINALAYIEQHLNGDPGMVSSAPASKPADPFAARYGNTDWSKII